MERILLVEPNYKNKYPPIGLMKISTYFKNKGDFVEFHKGLLPQTEVSLFDKVLITTLFTFDFNMCVQTIRYYNAIVGAENVYVGGISATIMPENFMKEIPELNIIEGQILSSKILGYEDDVNIDILELDYDILWDISYDYPMSDSYFIYTTRGCPRKCPFCAVKTLEPNFYECDRIEKQVTDVDNRFGQKKQLLIMDNNILFAKNFDSIIDEIRNLGFGRDNNIVKKTSNIKYYIASLKWRLEAGKKYGNLLNRIKDEFLNLNFVRINRNDSPVLKEIIEKIQNDTASEIIECLFENSDYLIDFFERYHYHKIKRTVDFNQGLDARLFEKEKAEKLAELMINPCRIAFDDLSTREEYLRAMERAVESGISRFSNYLLYNYKDEPKDLWTRLNINIQFCKEHDNIQLFSFPMKYAAIDRTDRHYLGKEWHKKYLRAINVILNVTSGVVAKEEDFFLRAFGKNETEFLEIMTMPDEFIRHRKFFEDKGLTQLWTSNYRRLSQQEKKALLDILDEMSDNPDILHKQYSKKINNILFFYSIRKRNVTDNLLFYSRLVDDANQEVMTNDSAAL